MLNYAMLIWSNNHTIMLPSSSNYAVEKIMLMIDAPNPPYITKFYLLFLCIVEQYKVNGQLWFNMHEEGPIQKALGQLVKG